MSDKYFSLYLWNKQTNNMKLYSTIKEAFNNGTGDVFFTLDETSFIAVSRHDAECFEVLQADGFRMMDYDETMRLDKEQRAVAEKEIEQPIISCANVNFAGMRANNFEDTELAGYMNDFPEFFENYGL